MKRFGLDFESVTRAADKTFYAPLHWKEPRRIFVCPWGDFFHEAADEWRLEALRIMASTDDRHTYIIPTKRTYRLIYCLYGKGGVYDLGLNFLPNVWILASVEDQATAEKRITELLRLGFHPSGGWPVLGVSYEPALGPVDFNHLNYERTCEIDALNGTHGVIRPHRGQQRKLDWLVMGGESGPNARPMHPDWVRQTRDACVAAGVPFFFKQWGRFKHTTPYTLIHKSLAGQIAQFTVVSSTDKREEGKQHYCAYPANITEDYVGKLDTLTPVGGRAAGHIIDGQEWRQLPEVGA